PRRRRQRTESAARAGEPSASIETCAPPPVTSPIAAGRSAVPAATAASAPSWRARSSAAAETSTASTRAPRAAPIIPAESPAAPPADGTRSPPLLPAAPPPLPGPGRRARPADLVPADVRQRHRIVALPGVPVRPAHAGRAHLDEHPVGRASRVGDLGEYRRGP